VTLWACRLNLKKLAGYNLLLFGIFCLVAIFMGMKEQMAGIKPADRVPFWIGMMAGLAVFLLPAYFLLRSSPPPDEPDPVDGEDEAPPE
jgi:hypothetical protein